jgi:diguanylate cyclase (GGDEF)-like protein/putative nucleotidyltransferase with HDIG domain
MSRKATSFYWAVCAAGLAALALGAWYFAISDLSKFLVYLFVAGFASRLKINIPEINGTVSVNFIFILIGIAELNYSETLIIGCTAILTQSLMFRERGFNLTQSMFNVLGAAFAVAGAYYTYNGPLAALVGNSPYLLIMLAACVYFILNTLPVATIISLTERKSLPEVWRKCCVWSFPYYLAGAGIAGLVTLINRQFSWQTSLLAFPAMFVIHRSYRLYLNKLESEKRQVEDIAGLHLRTIEALALAIEAKDQTSQDHLQRVRVYAVELGKRLHLSQDELEALRAAALLHDIGKLGVPENIISKPGRLTPEEFEKMKIHPIVGAEILDRVQFPYPVVPIVRAHHERWDGTGYPDGLCGESIPIGARILAAVDCLDALTSDRQYRSGITLEQAMNHVASESGRAFDPKVVALLKQNYLELEKLAALGTVVSYISIRIKRSADRPPKPSAVKLAKPEPPPTGSFLTSIAAARQEAQTLFELSHDLGNSLSLDETLSVLSVRLKKLIPYASMAAYILRGEELVPEYVGGDNFRLFAALRIPLGAGLSGWVAANRKSILNGDPASEPGYTDDPAHFQPLRSAISVPLEGLQGVVGVLTLYSTEADAYTPDHLRILMAISNKVALSVENALAFQQAENSATTDYLTELPNARSLFLHLDRETARCRRLKTSLTVMVCDLDGFKQINDRFGHLEGNRILRLFARSLQGSCREYDYVARMGGDEFVIVAPGLGTSAARARGICLSELASAAGREVSDEATLSLSVGCAMFPEDGSDSEQLLAEADRRMYRDKQQKRGDGEWLANDPQKKRPVT